MTPFHLVYSGEAVILVEVGMESARVVAYDEANTKRRLLELDFLTETRNEVATRLQAYKQQMCQAYN